MVEKGKEDCVESVVDEGSLGDGSETVLCVCVCGSEGSRVF